ncbi:LytTr DNA-binding domain protein [compost metagenome]
MKGKTNIINYKDFLFRTISCLLAAHVIVKMGRPDLSTFQAFTIPSYYPTLAINFIIALVVAFAVKKITILLDRNHQWYRDIWRRALLQFVFGVMAVSILSFFLVWLYFHAFEKDIVDSGYLDYELPFSIALITILNFYYVAYYFYTYPRISKLELPNGGEVIAELNSDYAVGENKPITDNYVAGKKKELKEILIVETSLRSIPVHLKDIAMFFIFDRGVFIRTMGVKSFNDCLTIPNSLGDIMEFVDGQTFFRINRKCIINFYTIDSFRPFGGKSLLITLKTQYDKMENLQQDHWQKLIIVSGDKVSDFKNWMNR